MPSTIGARDPCACFGAGSDGSLMTGWGYLGVAILLEVIATSALKAAAGFTRLLPSAAVVLGYTGAFLCLSVALRTVPMGLAYAIWSGSASS